MNSNQKSALTAFAAVANWSILHPSDEKDWQKFIKQAKANPDDIQVGDVYGVLRSTSTNQCPDEIAYKYDLLCRRSKDGFVKRLILLLKELFYNPEN